MAIERKHLEAGLIELILFDAAWLIITVSGLITRKIDPNQASVKRNIPSVFLELSVQLTLLQEYSHS